MHEYLTQRRGVRPRPLLWLTLVALGALAAAAAGQAEAPEPESPDRMAPLADMVGTWEGEGWVRRGAQEPSRFDSREVVESLLGGEALLIEGTHRDRETGEVGHHAVALLSWDPDAGSYRFASHVAGRGPGDFDGHMDDDVFVWGGPIGPGQVRYRITIEGDTWQETGEFSRDGEAWNQFFEMTLERRE